MHSDMDDPKRAGFPHSEILGSQPGYRLPEAYRRFQRPSSPLDAKTFTVSPCWLAHAIPTSTPNDLLESLRADIRRFGRAE